MITVRRGSGDELGVQGDLGAGQRLADGQPTLAPSAVIWKSSADMPGTSAGPEHDAGDALARLRRPPRRGVSDASGGGAGLGQRVREGPSSSRSSAPPRSAPRGWFALRLLGPIGPGDVEDAEPDESSETRPAPSISEPSQWALAMRRWHVVLLPPSGGRPVERG